MDNSFCTPFSVSPYLSAFSPFTFGHFVLRVPCGCLHLRFRRCRSSAFPPKHTFSVFDVTNYSALRLVLQEERLLWPLLTSLGGSPRPHGISHTSFIIYSPDLRILRLRLPLGTSLSLASLSAQDVPSYQVSVRRATISLLLLLSRFLCGTCKSLWGSSATTPLEWTFTTDV